MNLLNEKMQINPRLSWLNTLFLTIIFGSLDSPYTGAISAGILKLQEKGILQDLKRKWWKEMHGGGQCIVS